MASSRPSTVHFSSGVHLIPLGELDLREFSIAPVAGSYELRFTALVSYDAKGIPEPHSVWHVWSEITVAANSSGGGRPLGRAGADPIYLAGRAQPGQPNAPDKRTAPTTLILELDRTKLNYIEDLRNGRDLTFTFQLDGWASHGGEISRLSFQTHLAQFTVGQSEWIQQLTNSGYGRYLSFDIRLPDEMTDPALGDAIISLQNAVAALERGDVDEAIGDCRPGLDVLWQRGRAKFLSPQWEEDADKEERFWRVATALRTVAHAPHHPLDKPRVKREPSEDDADSAIQVEPGERIRFDRADAQATIAGLAVLIMQRLGATS